MKQWQNANCEFISTAKNTIFKSRIQLSNFPIIGFLIWTLHRPAVCIRTFCSTIDLFLTCLFLLRNFCILCRLTSYSPVRKIKIITFNKNNPPPLAAHGDERYFFLLILSWNSVYFSWFPPCSAHRQLVTHLSHSLLTCNFFFARAAAPVIGFTCAKSHVGAVCIPRRLRTKVWF